MAMSNIYANSSDKWPIKLARMLNSIMTPIIFVFLDFLDWILCIFFKFLDQFFEGKASTCYCDAKEEEDRIVSHLDDALSQTLHERKNIFRQLSFFNGLITKYHWKNIKKGGVDGLMGVKLNNSWSDCGCKSCLSWMNNQMLHLLVKQPSQASSEECRLREPVENVIFLHGFLSSSSLWTETVFPNISESTKDNYRLFAVDLLGFGKSPKPRDCLYTLREHLEMVEKSVINPFGLESFHLVSHSMGCVIALALAAKHPNYVKTITMIAPPYFPSSDKEDASQRTLRGLAGKTLWPPLSFGSSVMSWYEHLGRCVCFLICRNHRIWEWIFKLITRRDNVHFMLVDLTRHTHHSAWHTMHNVICGGAKLMDQYLGTLRKCGVRIHVLQGDCDQVVPSEWCNNIKIKVPNAHVYVVPGADHSTVILGREEDFTLDLKCIWESSG